MGKRASDAGIDPVRDENGQPLSEGSVIWMQPGSPHAIQHHLGRKLQGMYAQIPATPLPDRLNQLLTQLDTAGGSD
ncbi:hypothetical protein JCM16408A_14600 [Methylobacterium phyllosphaerae]